MKKVLQTGKFYPILGGVEKVMWDLTIALNGAGVSCDMLCAKFDDDIISEEDASAIDGHLVTCRALTKRAGTMIAPSMVSWLRKHCREYDIIHIHHPDPMAALALRLSGYHGNVVLHWHSDIISQKMGLACYMPLQRWLVKRAAVVIGTTPVYLDESPHLKECQAPRIPVPIGIKPVSFDSVKAAGIRKEYNGKHIVLSVGRLVPYKDYNTLIGAAARLPEDYEFVIVGTGPLLESLTATAGMLGVADRIHFKGRLGDDDLHAYMAACDVLALTSSMKTEAFGIVQIEAFSLGKPVVSTMIPGSGVSWVNADGISGLTVPVGDPEAAADAIRKICEDPSLKSRLEAGAASRFAEMFEIEQMKNKIISVYENYFNF